MKVEVGSIFYIIDGKGLSFFEDKMKDKIVIILFLVAFFKGMYIFFFKKLVLWFFKILIEILKGFKYDINFLRIIIKYFFIIFLI